jgi:hypothetical protein
VGQTTGGQDRPTRILWRKDIIMEKLDKVLKGARAWLDQQLPKVSADTLGWLAVILMHAATIPSLLALLTGLSDRTPGLDIVLFIWAGLVLLFGRAIVLKDTLNIVTIGVGFITQAVIMAVILFK